MANNKQDKERFYNSIKTTLWIAVRLSSARQISIDISRANDDIRLFGLTARERDLLTFIISDLQQINKESLDVTKSECEEFLDEIYDIKLDLEPVLGKSHDLIKLCNDIIAILKEMLKQFNLRLLEEKE